MIPDGIKASIDEHIKNGIPVADIYAACYQSEIALAAAKGCSVDRSYLDEIQEYLDKVKR